MNEVNKGYKVNGINTLVKRRKVKQEKI